MTAVASAESRKITWRQVAETEDPEIVRSAIAGTTRRWATYFLAAGIFQLIGATGMALRDPVWGAVLILAGAASFVFRSAAMLAAYGVLIAWAMFSNLLSGNWYGMVGAAVQAFLAFGAFRRFLLLRRATIRLDMGLGADLPARSDRAAGVFPFAGCALTTTACIGVVVLIVGAGIWYAVNEQGPSEQALGMAVIFLTDLACLGLALAVAALLARYRFRAVSTLAVVGGALLLAGVLVLAILG
jgi:hypothetical protein